MPNDSSEQSTAGVAAALNVCDSLRITIGTFNTDINNSGSFKKQEQKIKKKKEKIKR